MNTPGAWLGWPEVQILAGIFGPKLRFVGGCVRDTLLGREVGELDAATITPPEQTIALLEQAGIRAIPTGIAHGTITAVFPARTIEITTLRRDVATDGRHAEIAFTAVWEEDARRRDFTMNALYMDAEGTLYDPLGGRADCEAKNIRFIGDAAARIREDYLRILRYFRFAATLGENRFDPEALAACTAEKQGIQSLSGERITSELLKLLAARDSYACLLTMQQLGVLAEILAAGSIEPLRMLDRHAAPALLKLAALIGSDAALDAVAARLKLSTRQCRQLTLWLSHATLFTPSLALSAQKKLRRKLGAGDYLFSLQLAAAQAGNWDDFQPLEKTIDWQPPEFPVSANDLMQAGLSEGKPLGDMLRMLEKDWEDSDYSLTKDALLTCLR